MINMNDLLEATGLIDLDLDEETFDRLTQSIEADLAEEGRCVGKASPGRSPG